MLPSQSCRWFLIFFKFLFHQIIDLIRLNKAAGVDNTFRRKFDREEYLERARERERQVSCWCSFDADLCFRFLSNLDWLIVLLCIQF